MKKDQKWIKPNGYCPECDSRSFGITSQRSTKQNPLYPWSMVLKSYYCQNCDTEIPAHLWNCKIENKSKTKLEWNKIYRNKLGLFDIARRYRDNDLVSKIITICDSEIAEAIHSDDAEEYFHIKILCLIYLNKKQLARECSLRAISAISHVKNKKIYVNYICLCLDTGDGEAAAFAFDLYKNELKNQNLVFLEKKVKSAVKNGILTELDRNKFILKNQQHFCPICLSHIKSIPRYPEYVCSKCVKKATDNMGRPVRFSQKLSSENLLGITTLDSYFLDNKENYGSDLCWIEGVPCRAEQARFGGIVIQKLTGNEFEQKKNRNEKIMELNSAESILQGNDSEIEYVDSSGNPISFEDIDLTDVEFEDEFGRKVDFKGNLIELTDSEIKWVEIAEKMLVAKAHSELIRHCRTGLENDKNKGNSKLWNLLGIGYAATGNILKAKESFLQSINCGTSNEIDSITFANFVTASFDLGDSKSGLLAIEHFFDQLNYDGKQIILDSLLEAVRTRLISKEDLSVRLKTILMMK